MSKHPLELDNAKAFLDIILGVIIALPLIELPQKAIELAAGKLPFDKTVYLGAATSMLLLISALIFSSFFWLEVREFIDRQTKFNGSIGLIEPRPGDGVHLARRVVFGSILQITFIVAILESAKANYFRAFISANILFWTLDMIGTGQIKRLYRKPVDYTATIAEIDAKHRPEDRWFIAHLTKSFYYWYSFLYALFFVLLLLLSLTVNHQVDGFEGYRLGAALSVLLATLVGHLYVRPIYFWRWLEADQRKSSSNAG